LLVNPNDAQALAEGLQQMMVNPAHTGELGRKGKEAVFGRFTADRMAEETAAVYAQYAR
jgi:glycosyltransferase involved in cell wall biosynthesis